MEIARGLDANDNVMIEIGYILGIDHNDPQLDTDYPVYKVQTKGGISSHDYIFLRPTGRRRCKPLSLNRMIINAYKKHQKRRRC